jgi:hypothetical protein
VLLQDSGTLRLGGMRRENRLDTESGKKGGNLRRSHARSGQLGEAVAPETRLGLAPRLDLTRLAGAAAVFSSTMFKS